MKNFMILGFFMFFLSCTNEDEIYKIKAKNGITVKILDSLNEEIKIKKDSDIIFMNVSETSEKKIIIRISMFDNEELGYFNCSIGKPYGFFYYKTNIVVVYGNVALRLFDKTSISRNFDFLIIKNDLKVNSKSYSIPLPPSNFEPTVYVYELENGGFKFIYKDFNLIDTINDSLLVD